MKLSRPSRTRLPARLSFLEPLETRIAPASVVSSLGGSVLVQDQSNGSDHIVFSVSGPNFRFVDAGGLTAGSGANQVNGTTVEVPISGVTGSISILTGGNNDTVTLNGNITTPGDLIIDTGLGTDSMSLTGALTTGGDINLTSTGNITFANAVGLAATKTLTANAGGTISLGSSNADLTATGTGSISLTTLRDISLTTGSSITTADGALFLSANQQGVATIGAFPGVDMNGSLVQVTGTGALTVLGRGGIAATDGQYGIHLGSGASILGGASGLVTITGTGGGGTGQGNDGVNLTGSGALISSGGAAVQVTGVGDGSGATGGSSGVSVITGATISAGGAGSVTVQGTGGGGPGGGASGVTLLGTVGSSAIITSSGGAVGVTGIAGSTGGSNNYGVSVGVQAHISAGGTGSVTVTGTGGATAGDTNIGVRVDTANAFISATGGNLIISGSGGGTAGSTAHNNEGVAITNGAHITGATGGTVSITGHGGLGSGADNLGIELSNSSSIQSGRDITLIATEGAGGAPAVRLSSGGGSIVTTGTGNIALVADSLSIGSGVNVAASAHTVTLLPFTNGVGIDLGSALDPVGGPLSLSNAELSQITAGFLNVGGALSGAVTVSAALTLSSVETFTVTSGPTFNIGFTGLGQIDTGANGVALVSGNKIVSGAVAIEVTAGDLALATIGADIGSSTNSFGFSALNLDVMTNGLAGDLYLDSTTTVNFTNLDAATGTLFLRHGTFVMDGSSGSLNSNSNLALDGTLDLNGNTVTVAKFSGANTGVVTNSTLSPASFAFGGGSGSPVTYAGTIEDGSNPVQITKLGAGTEIFTKANSYSGTTTIAAGRLELGAGTSQGSLGSGSVSILGTLAFNRSNTLQVPNNFSGSGSLEQNGTGVTILTGTSVLTGAVTINAGTLQLGSGGSGGGLGLGTVLNKGLLVINRIDSVTIANDISGTGGLTQFGGGTTVLSGANTYSGTTTVHAGTLRLDSVTTSLDGPLTLDGGTLAYNLGGTFVVQPTVTLSADSTVSVVGGSRVDWSGNSVLSSGSPATFDLTKSGFGILSHDDSPWNVNQVFIQSGALVAATTAAFGTDPIDVNSGAAFWIEGSNLTLANAITLRGNGSNVSGPGPSIPGALVHNTGGGSVTLTGAITLALDSTIDTTAGNLVLNGIVSGIGGLTKTGLNNLVLGNKKNTFGNGGSTIITVSGGALQIDSDKDLGDLGNSLVFATGGGLVTKAGLTSNRNITVTNDAIFDITGTLKLLGTIGGAGVITKVGTGSLVFGTGYTGSTTVSSSSGPITIGTAKIAVSGTGSAVVTLVDDGLGGKKIETLALANTTSATNVVIKGPSAPGSTLVVDHIINSDAAAEIGSITLRKGVILGDGLVGAAALDIAGKVGKITLDTVSPNALIRLGTGLTYNNPGDDTSPDTYNNHPDLIVKGTIGSGTIVDVLGDGLPAGTGGGGLGKVIVNSWAGTGTIRTTQSIASFTLRNGDCNVVFEVDKNHTGAATVADVTKMAITHGAWGSTGSEIEGAIGSFSGQAFLAGATVTAANILKFSIKNGPFAGTLTLTKADDARLGSFTVNGNFTGTVDAAEGIKNVVVKGDFHGSLSAKEIGSIQAYTFDGTAIGDTFGDATRLNIIAREGSLGTLKAKAGGIKNYDISAATIFAGFNVPKVTGVTPVPAFGIQNVTATAAAITGITSVYSVSNSVFVSATTIGKMTLGSTGLPTADFIQSTLLAGATLGEDRALGGAAANADTFAAGSMGAITIKGSMTTGSFIGAGVNPGDLILGNAGDTVVGGLTSKIAAIVVTGTVSADSHFTAGVFKPKPKIGNVMINTATDVRFTVG